METLQADLWRLAARATGIAAMTEAALARLAEELPVGALVVRRFEPPQRRVVTVAAFALAGEDEPPRARSQHSTAGFGAVLVWAAGRSCTSSRDPVGAETLELVLADSDARPAIAGPLWTDEGAAGALVVLAARGRVFTPAHVQLVERLLEPFSVALENERRRGELERLREAAEADNRALLTRLQRHDISASVLGAETGLRDVMARVEKVAATDAPVLIFGETGSGKEVIARAIHARSARARGPVVRVNCGAIPPELVDSELFGHEKGSFTGATATHTGWFERADGGTLFLDEIGELPLAVQVRLLRVLQDGTFERVGGRQSLAVDVRLVAATHRDLDRMVAEGRFRQDLWYRISVFPIRLPPLRERREDIAELATHFSGDAGRRLGGVPLVPRPEDLRLLLAYDWPGNVRELASVIERAVILGDGRRLEIAAALGGVNAPRLPPKPPAGDVPAPASAPRSALSSLDAAQRRHIEEALEATLGRIDGPHGAARALGINPHTLRSRMRKLGIDWRKYRYGV